MKPVKDDYKVLYITSEFGKHIAGGVGRVINGIAANLGELIPFSVFHLKFNFFRKDWDVYLHHYAGGTSTVQHYTGNFRSVLKKLLLREKYAVVHLMYSGENSRDCLYETKTYSPSTRTVYSCHSISKYEFEVRKNSLRSVEFEEDIVSHIDHIHFLNNASFNYFKTVYPEISERTSSSIIPNGIDENEYLQTDPQWMKKLNKKTGTNKITVSCLSRWSYGKGLEYLLDAIPRVINRHNNVRFILAGKKLISWENGYHRFLFFINKKLEANRGAVFPLGWLDNIRRNSIYAMTDIYIMPSLLEYYPYAILEPMVTRAPIISSRIDAVTELLKDGEDCFLYEPTNAEELAEKILLLIRSPELQDRFRNNAYQKVKKANNWQNIVREYAGMYQTLLQSSRILLRSARPA